MVRGDPAVPSQDRRSVLRRWKGHGKQEAARGVGWIGTPCGGPLQWRRISPRWTEAAPWLASGGRPRPAAQALRPGPAVAPDRIEARTRTARTRTIGTSRRPPGRDWRARAGPVGAAALGAGAAGAIGARAGPPRQGATSWWPSGGAIGEWASEQGRSEATASTISATPALRPTGSRASASRAEW